MRRAGGLFCSAVLSAAWFTLAGATAVQAEEPGVSDQQILFGQSAAFSGPAQDLGRNMRLGIEAAFEEANRSGGVHGRMLVLMSLDDGYEPEAAIVNTRQLIAENGVFALIGAVGTPTSRSATPIAADARVPYLAPFTGAEFLRDREWRNVINLRASYYQETEEMVSRLLGDLGIDRVAIIYQDDSFGQAGYRGVRRALERRGLEAVAIGVYPRNTTAVKTALLDLRGADPGAVVLVGAYKPVAALIAWARHIGFDPVFLTISFVGSNALVRELGAAGAGVFVTQVVPFPDGERASRLPLPIAGPWRLIHPRPYRGSSPSKAIWRAAWRWKPWNAAAARSTVPVFWTIFAAPTSSISEASSCAMARTTTRDRTPSSSP